MKKFDNGIYADISNEDYHASMGISKSLLDAMNKGAAYFVFERNAPRFESLSLGLGTLVHCLLLEPKEYENRYLIAPECDRRTKEGKATWEEFQNANDGSKKIVSAKDDSIAHSIAECAMAHPLISKYLQDQDGKAEVSIYFTDPTTDLQCKIRPDWLIVREKDGRKKIICIDVKTTSDFGNFASSVWNYRYHVQQEFYRHGLSIAYNVPLSDVEFYFAVVSTSQSGAVYPCDFFDLADPYQPKGEAEYKRNLLQCKEFKDFKVLKPSVLEMPEWQLRICEKDLEEHNNSIL